ncbi:hypothetical protein Tco_0736276 [Tanacetum coccineum]
MGQEIVRGLNGFHIGLCFGTGVHHRLVDVGLCIKITLARTFSFGFDYVSAFTCVSKATEMTVSVSKAAEMQELLEGNSRKYPLVVQIFDEHLIRGMLCCDYAELQTYEYAG